MFCRRTSAAGRQCDFLASFEPDWYGVTFVARPCMYCFQLSALLRADDGTMPKASPKNFVFLPGQNNIFFYKYESKVIVYVLS